MLNEYRRRVYLEAMGVESLIPRLQLPGAKPSTRCEWLSETPLEAVVNVSAGGPVAGPGGASAVAQSGAAAARDLLRDGPPSTRREVAESAGSGPDTARAAQSIARFSLTLVRAGRVLLVDEGLSGDSDPQHYLRFVSNILYAVGLADVPLSVESFIWPLPRVRGDHVDRSEAAARQALAAYLSKQLEHSGAGYLLLMGETAPHYAVEADVSPGELRHYPPFAVQALVTVSAQRSMTDPALKPLLWSELAPLVKALGAGA